MILLVKPGPDANNAGSSGSSSARIFCDSLPSLPNRQKPLDKGASRAGPRTRNATKFKQAHPVTAQAPGEIRLPRQPVARLAALRA